MYKWRGRNKKHTGSKESRKNALSDETLSKGGETIKSFWGGESLRGLSQIEQTGR